MRKILMLALTASTILVSCNSANTTEKKATATKLPNLDTKITQESNFEKDFLPLFKPQTLPFKVSQNIKIQDTIKANEVMQHIILPAGKEKITAFQDFYGENEAMTRKGLEDRFLNQEKNIFMVLNAGFGQRIDLHPDFYTLTFQVIPTFMEGSYAYTYLANFDKKGNMIDAVQIAAQAGYTDRQQFTTTEINAEGQIKIENKSIKRGGFEDGTKDFTEFAYTTYKINPKGKLGIEQELYTGLSGNFVGKESAEIFRIEQHDTRLQVVYQAAPEATEQYQLEVVQFNPSTRTIIAKHPEKDLQFVLTYDQPMKQISAKTSTGKSFSLTRKS